MLRVKHRVHWTYGHLEKVARGPIISTVSEYQNLNPNPGLQTPGPITKFSHHYSSRYFGKDSTVFTLMLTIIIF